MVLSLCACAKDKNDTSETTDTTSVQSSGTSDIHVLQIPDPEMLGAWKAADGTEDDPVIIFTTESTVRIVKGTMTLESDVTYGEDSLGNKSIATSCSAFYGQSVYKIDGDVLTISTPVTDDDGKVESFNDVVYNAVHYTPITLEAKSDFTPDKDLVGVWSYAATREVYEFTEDGYVIITVDAFNGNDEDNTTLGTYTVNDGELTVYIYANSTDEISETQSYSIDGTKLLIGESDYYLNGEGDPSDNITITE